MNHVDKNLRAIFVFPKILTLLDLHFYIAFLSIWKQKGHWIESMIRKRTESILLASNYLIVSKTT